MQNIVSLRDIFNNVNDWLKFAEAKNFGLLTLNGVFAFGLTQVEASDEFKWVIVTSYYCFIPFSLISFIWCLISLFPILTKIDTGSFGNSMNKLSNWIDSELSFENIHYYGYIRNLTVTQFEAEYLQKTSSQTAFTEFEKELVNQILYNSRITWLKFQCFKIGAFFFFTGFILTLILLPIIFACR